MNSPSPYSADGPPTLESLAERAQKGDATSREQLAERVREPLRRFLVSRLAREADADDVAQETLLRAFSRLDQYDPERPFQTWLFTIGKRLAVNHGVADDRRRARQVAAHEGRPGDASQPQDGDIWERAQAVLSAESYRAIWMRYSEDASVRDVAKALGRTVVSTKVLLHRARKRLLREVI